ncbi:MAG: 4-hydroxy-tetrahydrodipicolinate reductase [Chloroflexi bacterium]|nr:4-hydroxy-tetrahydrodipicolinate reductase [Chloroflexota bacterium]
MPPIKVVVQGASGRMGREVLTALCRDPDIEPVGAVDVKATEDHLSLPNGSGLIPFAKDMDPILQRVHPRVVVDFSAPEASVKTARIALKNGVSIVIGTTGLSPAHVDEVRELARQRQVGAVIAPNFALGAILLMHLAKLVARYFDEVEVIELHHDQKADAPSGTAIATARAMLEARGKPFNYPPTTKETLAGTRGGQMDGVAIHSIRLQGLLAHQEVIFGGPGQTLSLRHDTISRECFMPGVLLAVKEVVKRQGLVYGLDALLGLR